MEWYFIGIVISFLLGMLFMDVYLLFFLHKKMYGTFKLDKKHFPFCTKIKEQMGIEKDEYLD